MKTTILNLGYFKIEITKLHNALKNSSNDNMENVIKDTEMINVFEFCETP